MISKPLDGIFLFWSRIINFPARGIGKTSVEKAILIANENNISMWNVLERAAEFGYRANTLGVISNFVTMIRMFQSELQKKNAYDLATIVGKSTGIIKELFNDKTTEGLARYENIQELLNSIKEFTDTAPSTLGTTAQGYNADIVDIDSATAEVLNIASISPSSPGADLGSYLQQITLLTDSDEDKGESDVVKLMTIHSAKGLEFPVIFVGGLEETLFPSAMSINTREELEEERRLFYVAVTRAKHKLWLTYANTRYRFGNLTQNEPSRFIDELPAERLDKAYAGGNMRNNQTNHWNPFDTTKSAFARHAADQGQHYTSKPAYINTTAVVKIKEHIPSPDFAPSDTGNLQEGQKVEHQKFGFGEVIKMEGAAHNPIATVKFEHNGEKKIMLNYARLRIIM